MTNVWDACINAFLYDRQGIINGFADFDDVPPPHVLLGGCPGITHGWP